MIPVVCPDCKSTVKAAAPANEVELILDRHRGQVPRCRLAAESRAIEEMRRRQRKRQRLSQSEGLSGGEGGQESDGDTISVPEWETMDFTDATGGTDDFEAVAYALIRRQAGFDPIEDGPLLERGEHVSNIPKAESDGEDSVKVQIADLAEGIVFGFGFGILGYFGCLW